MISQVCIFIFGVTAVWLSQSPNISTVRYSSIVGLMSQPFWFYSTLSNELYGMFCLSLVYTLAWARGFNNHWIKNIERQEKMDISRSTTENGELLYIAFQEYRGRKLITEACSYTELLSNMQILMLEADNKTKSISN